MKRTSLAVIVATALIVGMVSQVCASRRQPLSTEGS